MDRSQKNNDDSRIPLVLTYHPAFFKVHEILRNCSNTLFVDDKHRNLFQNKMFISFRRAKNLKDTLVRAKIKPLVEEQVEKGTFRCNGRRSCQICPIVVEGDYGAAGGSKIIRRGTYAPWEQVYFQALITLSEAHLIFISGSDRTIEGAPRSNIRLR